MISLRLEKGRIKIGCQAVAVGEDLCVIIYGGDSPHIGCVTISIPRPSLVKASDTSATTSVLSVLGHKDDEVARHISHKLAARLDKTVVVTCGIHLDQITQEEIKDALELMQQLTDMLVEKMLEYR